MKTILFVLLLAASSGPQALAQTIATLRPGDIFEMRLGGVAAEFAQDFNSQYTVGQEGNVNLPMLGEVRAVGLTPQQLEKAIQTKLVAEKIFTHPAVNLNLIQNNRFITMGGGVRQPGRQPWSNDLTLSSAVAAAGGLGDFGSPKGCRLIRDGKVTIYDLRKVEKDPGSDPKLLPGDQVVVRQ